MARKPPPDPEALLAEGRALHAQRRLGEAFTRYQAALAVAPEHADAHHLLGLAYLGLGQPQAGIAFLRRAIARRPEAADYHVNLATALVDQGQLEEAAAELQTACSLAPQDAQALAAWASLQWRLERFAQAEDGYVRAQALAPRRADLCVALARLRYRRWALPEAVASANEARALSPAVAQELNIGWMQPRPGTTTAPSSAQGLVVATSLDGDALARACADRELLVLDDFLDDPLAFRDEALERCSRRAEAIAPGNYPGVQTVALPCEATMQRIAEALGRPIKWDSPDNGAVRLSVASDVARSDVHVDNPMLDHIFGGVLYLSLPEHCRGGTAFYRHRATGWERRPNEAQLRAHGYASVLDFQRRSLSAGRRLPFAQWQRERDASWERVLEVPMRFNRLIVYRSDFFHAITELFGSTPRDGRLVQLFHFEGKPTTD